MPTLPPGFKVTSKHHYQWRNPSRLHLAILLQPAASKSKMVLLTRNGRTQRPSLIEPSLHSGLQQIEDLGCKSTCDQPWSGCTSCPCRPGSPASPPRPPPCCPPPPSPPPPPLPASGERYPGFLIEWIFY